MCSSLQLRPTDKRKIVFEVVWIDGQISKAAYRFLIDSEGVRGCSVNDMG